MSLKRSLPEMQYLKIIKNIVNNGVKDIGRNGITHSQIGAMMRFPLKNNTMPLITTKKLAWRVCLKELLWFIKGDTDNGTLQSQNVKIWNGNASRNFLDSRKLYHLDQNDLGPIYGHQWRFWNAEYKDNKTDYTGKGIDQLQNIIEKLKNKDTRNSRRLILSAWNPEQIQEMALPPCHVLSQFHVTDNNKLSCTLYQRSADMGLGVPFNIASYAFLTHLLAKHCDLEAHEFVHFLGNAHIYDDHIKHLKEQITKIPHKPPKLIIKNKYSNINDYKIDDFEIKDYKCYEKIPMNMRV